MKKVALYEYLGTNGTILSPVHLEGIYFVRKWELTADAGKVLVKDGEKFGRTKVVPDEELSEWGEVWAVQIIDNILKLKYL